MYVENNKNIYFNEVKPKKKYITIFFKKIVN